ncbi:DNA-J related domain-containing protein [Celerinatantimonas yamalensis]|uniref:DNA-J related domain-containing protein n=1 Tax=Celerinatantimonas yamalensis TaxID=559956 RepID=A0ABW9G389_9GAMM
MQTNITNPLNSAVLEFLAKQAHSITEYQLLQRVKSHPFMQRFSPSSPELRLFQQHFLLMNALYQLQENLSGYGYGLLIHALKIEMITLNTDTSTRSLNQSDPLRDYYLDWQQLAKTNENDVQTLLNSFWRQFKQGSTKQHEALNILDLPKGANQAQIQKQYRILALRYHPDRGGDPQRFSQICRAYQQLKH